MKKLITYIFALFVIIIPVSSFAEIEKGKWNFVKDSDYCYIGSGPVNVDIPEGKKRGDTYILIVRINKSKEAFVQIELGYPIMKDNGTLIKIDNTNFSFYSDEDTAWTNEDNKVIYAMKKGNNLIVQGQSSRGTKTLDKYSLKGFTVAYNKLFNDC
jgi:hypothetical protein|tara:strand:+ start:311 stop:778 length:468 start_codon:yes stop_codon:yes gene_type:complete